jgi:RNA polymerase sigma-70 factor (ECF subfamily)
MAALQALMMDAPPCEELWRRHADSLLLYATTLLGDRAAAEDVLQNVFVRLLSTESRPPVESEGAYLFRAVRNESLNAMRSRRTAARAVERLFRDTYDDPRDTLELADLGRRVSRILQEIPEEEREAVALKIWGDLSFPEAAEVAGVSEKTFEHRYYRGLEAIKQKVKVRHE